ERFTRPAIDPVRDVLAQFVRARDRLLIYLVVDRTVQEFTGCAALVLSIEEQTIGRSGDDGLGAELVVADVVGLVGIKRQVDALGRLPQKQRADGRSRLRLDPGRRAGVGIDGTVGVAEEAIVTFHTVHLVGRVGELEERRAYRQLMIGRRLEDVR